MARVSICIPTYNRPELLKVALESCLAQTFQDFEIVISDDSPDTRTEEMVREFSAPQVIRYVRNTPGLGQARNVNQLFSLASGEFLTLLHDDDTLLPTALADLIKPLQNNATVVASFGKQYLVTHEGTVLDEESRALNERYCKTDERANQIQRSAWSVLAAQFPPNGYLVRTAAARATLYRDDPEIGEACDGDFGFRLSKLGEFFFVGTYASTYRRTKDSISTRGLRILLSKLFFIVKGAEVPGDLEGVWRARLKGLAPVAVTGCLLMAARGKALKILLSQHYPWRQEFVKGSIQLCLVLAPRTASGALVRRRLVAPPIPS
jgi:glycosyltransferase involved in cell wall biosynthesis